MAEDTARTPRDSDLREHEVRASDAWVPPSVLPKPNPVDGWSFRWIRTAALGKADVTNVSQKLREGWVPVKSSEHPELNVMSDLDSRFEDGVEIGGLLLCKMPTEKVQQRNAHYAKQAANQMESVDHSYMKENDPRMPLLQSERTTRTQFGKG
jgi:hypothetical protein